MTKNWLTSVANASLRDTRKKESHQILAKGSGKKHSFLVFLGSQQSPTRVPGPGFRFFQGPSRVLLSSRVPVFCFFQGPTRVPGPGFPLFLGYQKDLPLKDLPLDYLVISETKLDESFPNVQFKLNGYELRARGDRH